jgi:hypothetical protein
LNLPDPISKLPSTAGFKPLKIVDVDATGMVRIMEGASFRNTTKAGALPFGNETWRAVSKNDIK